MGFFSDVSSIISSLNKYVYINSFYDMLSDGRDVVANSNNEKFNITNEELNDLLNFFKEAKNTAKSEMNNALLSGLEIVRLASKKHPTKARILNFVAGRYLQWKAAQYKLYNAFSPNSYETKIRARASKYMEDIANPQRNG